MLVQEGKSITLDFLSIGIYHIPKIKVLTVFAIGVLALSHPLYQVLILVLTFVTTQVKLGSRGDTDEHKENGEAHQ